MKSMGHAPTDIYENVYKHKATTKWQISITVINLTKQNYSWFLQFIILII